MTRIRFRGGDKDGQYLETTDALEDSYLFFDGNGGIASPRGKYEKSEETLTLDGVEWEIWNLASSKG